MFNLDSSHAFDIANDVVPLLEDAGYSTEEQLAGLVQSIIEIANSAGLNITNTAEILESVNDAIADGGFERETEDLEDEA